MAGLFVLLFLFPLILRLSRAKTSEDRRAAAHAERDRADLEADTAIAVKRAEVRAAVEAMWAERELATARLAVAAQTEIDREEQRRRVAAAVEAPTPVSAERVPPVDAVPPNSAYVPPTWPDLFRGAGTSRRRLGGHAASCKPPSPASQES